MTLFVNEIFHSIQGESSFAGYPCVFVRLTGCNLRCTYCDTQYAYADGQERRLAEIIDSIASFDCNLVEITGGEPLLQTETPRLIRELLDRRYTVLLETNGSRDIRPVDNRCVRIVDMKCPSSGESGKNLLENIRHLTSNDELKFVIGNREDFDFAKKIVDMLPKYHGSRRKVLFSAVFGALEPRELAGWILENGLNVRLQLQLHKYIWNPDLRGV